MRLNTTRDILYLSTYIRNCAPSLFTPLVSIDAGLVMTLRLILKFSVSKQPNIYSKVIISEFISPTTLTHFRPRDLPLVPCIGTPSVRYNQKRQKLCHSAPRSVFKENLPTYKWNCDIPLIFNYLFFHMFIWRPLREELDEVKQEPLTVFSEFPRCSIVCRARVRKIAPPPHQ